MKGIRSIILFGILFQLFVNNNPALFGQPVSLLRQDNVWSILEEDDSNPKFPGERIYKLSYYIKTGNDTVIDGKKYKIMLYSKDKEHQRWEDHIVFSVPRSNGSIFEVQIGGALMREEGGRVYRYSGYPKEKETLLYDFNLQEGDSISYYLHSYSESDTKIVSFVDSIRYTRVENLPRKIFYISNFKYSINYSNNRLGGRPEIWIEGIGSSWRLERDECKNYYLLGDNNTRWNSLCFYRNEKLLYHFPGFNDCYYHWVVGNPEIGSNLDFQLYPNPSSGKFTIRSGAENGNSRVQVFDISGRQVRSLQTDGSGYLEVDLSNVSPGTYLFRLSKSGSSGTRKVVIN